ncbi:class I SAM-dependent methyltransferase [Nocardia africana]|uniref:O-Methyltransferase involved in polyketide biosynthesis n=1 Tax=Nocardia africana TaxID=134964 RepID=A0A378X0H9_9NOCA|nr:class I SAM-dependent methyltransferase [Nocardia africana]MCC3312345.1 class I SAM-dependent methyltransferase [Nocardia africana]SUA46345.1 O-Methyltransferase involved in polyketide biosynthesis [Nocardia africana]
MSERKVTVTLDQLSATTLWTLRDRAHEAMRPRPLIVDPVAIEAYRRIDYDFGEFGRIRQSHVLRPLCFDRAVADFARRHPRGVVVALGDGLETGFWRSDSDSLRWLSVDLPGVIGVREQVMPQDPRAEVMGCSVVDTRWIGRVDADDGVLVTAQGLLGYLQPAEALGLIDVCAHAFPGGEMVFDTIPGWLRRRSHQATDSPRPPMPFHLTARQAARLPRHNPSISAVTELRLPAGRGLCGPIPFAIAYRIPLGSLVRPTTTHAQFARAEAQQ